MSRLIGFALTQRLLVLLVAAIVAFAGYRAFRDLPIDAFPDVSATQVKIIIKAPGMTPEEVETRITAPIEVELLGIPQQTMLRSITKYALTDITVDFAEGTDIYWARQQVADRLAGVADALPEGIDGGIAPMTTPLGEMFMFTVDGPGSLAERRALLEWVVRPALRTVPGVADVNVLGGYVRSFEVIPDAVRMAARGIDVVTLENAIAVNNRNDGAGRINEGEEALLVRSEGSIRGTADLGAIVVAVRDGVPVTVADVAAVRIGSITRYGAVTQSGEAETVQGLVLGLRGANARDVVEGARAKLAEIQSALPEGTELRTFYDRGDLVTRAIDTVARALAEAVILVIVLLLLFLGNLRAAAAVAVVLPLAALATFLLMRRFDMSANLMSLGGLAIAIGMLVDAAVVVVENVATHLGHERGNGKLPRLHIIYRSVREVAMPMASGIGIIIIVFLPLLSLQGIEGKLFGPVAMTISFALGASLLLSLTVIPVLASYLMRAAAHTEPWLPRKLGELYAPLLERSLARGNVVIAVAVALLVIAAACYPFIGKTFIPTMNEGHIVIQTEKLPSITLAESVSMDLRIERAILERVPDIERIVARVGSDEIGMDPMGLNEADLFLVPKPSGERAAKSTDEIVEAIRAVLDEFPGLAYGFTQPIEMRTAEMLTGTRGDIAVKLFGPDLAELSAKADEIAAVLRSIEGSEDVFVARNSGLQYLNVAVDRSAAGRFGIETADLQRILRAQIEGIPVGIVQEGVRRTPLVIRADETVRSSAYGFAALPLALGEGRSVPVSAVAKVERVDGVVSIARERGQRFIVTRSNVVGRDLVGFVDEAKRRVAEQVDLSTGYTLEWGGQFENQQRAAARLALVVPLAVGLVFMLLFSTFGSLRQALLVLANIPFAMIGGVFSLLVSGEYLSVPASIGFIALLGIAVLNGVVMVTYFNQLRAEGLTPREVVVNGAQRRLRPVLMTASIAAFGLVPLLFATGPGSEIQRPLAIVVIGGLISATALTLILLPILYERFGFERAVR